MSTGAASPSRTRSMALGLGVLLFGLGAVLWVLVSLPGPVFYSVDGGTKHLGVQQILAEGYGRGFFTPPQSWAASLWAGDAFPFRPPFATRGAEGWDIAFPLPFLAASAPGYALLGWAGLYLLPVLGLVLTWAIVAKRSASHWAGMGLLALCVASFATMYGATFWEHPLALALCTAALYRPDDPPPDAPASSLNFVGRGAMLGVAGFLRPEAWVLGACVVAAGALAKTRSARESMAMAAGLGALGAAFAAHNLALYGQLLGVHAQQLGAAADLAAGDTGMGYAQILGGLLGELFVHSPAAWCCVGLLLLVPAARAAQGVSARAFAFVLFVLLLPLVLPNAGGRQWGPRYLIVALPLLWSLAARSLQAARGETPARPASSPWPTRWLAATAALGLAYNVAHGARLFRHGYQSDSYKLVLALEAVKVQAVALAVPLQAGELAGYIEQWPYFLARDSRELSLLAAQLPDTVRSIAWIVPAPAAPAGSSFGVDGARALTCQYQGWALAAHYVVRCELADSPHSTGE